ncbi:type II secretion system secretin GspD [Palleronia rufa]|uniref:type II secretion system secretin GspD n=1 Tax=Palleronia rufa TaxID=1530186 RepID=UPI0009DEDB94|nr:type II secretion system secretin GspD [Palleronia rufa]
MRRFDRTAGIRLGLLALWALWASVAGAQTPTASGSYVLNLRDTDIAVLAEQVSAITGRTLILDPGLSGDVTVISAEELDEDGVWALFQSILRSRGFVAVPSGAIWEVVPEGDARTIGASDARPDIGSQDFVTRLLRLDRLPSAEAVRVLGPLVAEAGYIEAIADPNAIVVTDTRANVDRLFEIARTFDSDADSRTEVIRFAFSSAQVVGAAIVEVLGDIGTARISVDPQSNTLLVRGSAADVAQIRDLAAQMDVAPRANPREAVSTSIFRLNYGDAETVARIVQETLRGGADLTNAVAQSVGEEGAEPILQIDPAEAVEIAVTASTETNAVVVRGTARQIEEVGSLIRALDVQRPQVMIEAAIVEVSGDVADRLGVQLGLGGGMPSGGLAATSFGNGGTSLQSILVALGATGGSALSTGLSVAAGGDDFGMLVQALARSSKANLLSTPSITTLDNRPATIVVGQNVPFRTGSFATDGNTVAPFTTIERRDVGITMEVLPRVTAGGIVRLEIAQEVSSLVNTSLAGAADLITNRRVITTTVEAMNGGTIVLGGLITDDRQNTESKVPGLGDLPVVGNLFRARSRDVTRRTLFVFMRPRVLLDQRQIQGVAQGRLDRLNAAQVDRPPPARLGTKTPEIRRLPLEINGLY